MTRRLVASYLAFTVLVLVALEVPLGVQFARGERRDLTAKVERDAVAVASLAEDTLEGTGNANLPGLRALAGRYRRETAGRIVIVDRRGRGIVDSTPPAPGIRSFASRPELATALSGRVATGERYSRTLGTNLLYVAVPVASGGVVHGAVRVTYPTSAIDARIRRYWLALAAIAAVVLAAAGAAGWALARWTTRPLRDLERAAVAAGAGDLDTRAREDGPPEVRHVAAAFNETVAKLDDLLRSQEAFVADASHQLRTPLTALRLRLDNLGHGLPAGRRGDLELAQAEAARLARLVDGLLALARADAHAAPASRVWIDTAVGERLETWRPYAEERGVGLVGAAPRLAARTAADRIEQVLDNLLANALEAAPPGTDVEVNAAARAGWVELHVVDHGPGLTAEERARAFDRFWRGGAADNEGSGLGLAIVRRLVVADGGEVELRAAADGGLDALVRLRPAVAREAPHGASRVPHQ